MGVTAVTHLDGRDQEKPCKVCGEKTKKRNMADGMCPACAKIAAKQAGKMGGFLTEAVQILLSPEKSVAKKKKALKDRMFEEGLGHYWA